MRFELVFLLFSCSYSSSPALSLSLCLYAYSVPSNLSTTFSLVSYLQFPPIPTEVDIFRFTD